MGVAHQYDEKGILLVDCTSGLHECRNCVKNIGRRCWQAENSLGPETTTKRKSTGKSNGLELQFIDSKLERERVREKHGPE